jgi:uncharacterized protein
VASDLPAELLAKQSALEERLRGAGRLVVAFSGGVDSSYLAYAAHAALGEQALAATALSPSYPASHRELAEQVVGQFGIPHRFVDTHEMERADYRANRPDRCYFCKTELFGVLESLVDELGFDAIAYGVNTDDTGDFRPGHRAAAEHEVLSPFLDADLSKAEIRALSRAAGLPTAELPASACLASRLPYGTQVTPERLAQVERGEERPGSRSSPPSWRAPSTPPWGARSSRRSSRSASATWRSTLRATAPDPSTRCSQPGSARGPERVNLPRRSLQAPKARAARRSRAKLWCLRALPAGGPTSCS